MLRKVTITIEAEDGAETVKAGVEFDPVATNSDPWNAAHQEAILFLNFIKGSKENA